MFYYPEHTYVECLEWELKMAQEQLKSDINGVWKQRLNELKEELNYEMEKIYV